MARHKYPWCRSCNKRKAREPYELVGFCSQRCAAVEGLVAWDAMREGDGLDDWCHRCGRWSIAGRDWVGTSPELLLNWAYHTNLCKCPVPIPSEPYTEEKYDYDREEA